MSPAPDWAHRPAAAPASPPTSDPPGSSDPTDPGSSLGHILDQLGSLWHPALAARGESPPLATAGLSRFDLHEILGEGGNGIVFRATDSRLRRVVALKLPAPRLALRPDAPLDFLREARTAAGLDHPNIVRVHELDDTGPVCFISMAYCERGSLARWLDDRGNDRPVDPRWAADLVAQVADGVQHAHDRGVLHRDLKPSNILLQDAPQRADGPAESPLVPLVADFGLARLEAEENGTLSGHPVGTRPYMSPEQARGDLRAIGRPTDVYGLGVILFELLAGRRPFEADSPDLLLQRILHDDAPSLRSLRPSLPRDLDVIVSHCLSKSPHDRYPTAAELSVDLRRWLRHEPILARPPSLLNRARSWTRRHPVLAGALLLALAGSSATAYLADRADRQSIDLQVSQLAAARPDALPLLIDSLRPRPRLLIALRRSLRSPDVATRSRASVALASLGDLESPDILLDWLTGSAPDEVAAVATSLRSAPSGLLPTQLLLSRLRATDSPSVRLRAAAALAASGHRLPDELAAAIAIALVDDPRARDWAALFRPVTDQLTPALEQLLREGKTGAGSILPTLLEGFPDAPERLARLIVTSSPEAFRSLLDASPATGPNGDALLEQLTLECRPRGDDPCAPALTANAAAAIARLAPRTLAPEFAWPLLDRTADPTGRAFLVERLAQAGFPPDDILSRLDSESAPGPRQSLLLSLGQVPSSDWSVDARARAERRVLDLYRTDPDASIHSACKWLLHRWSEEPRSAELAPALRSADERLIAEGRVPGRRWWVHPIGFTLLVIHDPSLKRTLEVTDTEITVAQFRHFRPDHETSDVLGHDPDGPVYYVSAYDAIRFCQWLSDAENIPASERPFRVYYSKENLIPDLDRLDDAGYRLPMESEFRALARAGSVTRWPFGNCSQLLGSYAWHSQNAKLRLHTVGSLKPNDHGLFDVVGNAMEWCGAEPGNPSSHPPNQALLGGAFFHSADSIEADLRFPMAPSTTGSFHQIQPFGFRVVRTVPDPPPTRL